MFNRKNADAASAEPSVVEVQPASQPNPLVWQVKVFSGGRLVHVGRMEIAGPGSSRPAYWTGNPDLTFIEIETHQWVTVVGTMVIEAVARESVRPKVDGSSEQSERAL